MKKILAVMLAAALLLAAVPALAQDVTFGNYSVKIPDGMTAEELTADDTDAGITAYYYNDQFDMALGEFSSEGQTLDEYLEVWATETSAEQSGVISLNGNDAAYYLYKDSDDNGEYYTICYVMIDGDAAYEVMFYVDNDENLNTNSAATAAVMETLTRVQ